MGFMAGFGPAFAQSFGAARESRKKEESDMFKLTYQEFLNRREKTEEQERADAAAIKKARVYARDMTGDESNWPKIAEWIRADMSVDQIQEMIKGGDFEQTKITPPAAPDMIDPVDAQMGAAGLDEGAVVPAAPGGTPPATTAPTPEPVAPSGQGGLLEKMFPGRGGDKTQRMENQNFGKIAKVTGTTPEEVGNIMKGKTGVNKVDDMEHGIVYKRKPGGFEPDKINAPDEVWIEHTQAKRAYEENPSASTEYRFKMAEDRLKAIQDLEAFKAEKTAQAQAEASGNFLNMSSYKLLDEDGNYAKPVMVRKDGDTYKYLDVNEWKEIVPERLLPWEEGEKKAVQSVATAMKKIASEHSVKGRGVADLIYSAKDMSDIVTASQGKVLAEKTSALAGFAQDWAQEFRTIESLIEEDGDTSSIGGQLEKIDSKIDAMIGKGVSDLATQRSLLNAKTKIFAYKLGLTMGQEGRALAETERKVFEALANAGSSPEKFNQNLANIIKDQVRSLDGAAGDITEYNARLNDLKDTYIGWENNKTYSEVPTFDKVLNREPELKSAYDYFKPFMNTNARETPQTQQAVPEGYTAIGRTPDGKTVYRTPDGKQVVGK